MKKELIIENKYLLFGRAEHCHYWAKENLQDTFQASAKIVKHARDFLGMRNVILVYCGSFFETDYKLYKEAEEYFNQFKKV